MKVALVIIYNHQYNSNINKIEDLYKSRFTDIFHLVPFYKGDKKNVIPIYENSFYFQGYISQGLKYYFKDNYEHYFFIGDDLFLNPIINEDNYKKHLNLAESTSFIPSLINIHEVDNNWPRLKEAYNFDSNIPGLEIKKMLPNYEEAIEKFANFGLRIKPLTFDQLWNKPKLKFTISSIFKTVIFYKKKLNSLYNKTEFNLPYPIVGSYSDICVVDSNTIKEFSNLCGIFATMNLFVEIALPTALVLSAEKIVTEQNLILQGKALWTDEDHEILEKYEFKLNKLLLDFPEDCMYIHPIKLSKWIKN